MALPSLLALIQRIAWKGYSPNFGFTEFWEVRLLGGFVPASRRKRACPFSRTPWIMAACYDAL
jgi:hypothetical protein